MMALFPYSITARLRALENANATPILMAATSIPLHMEPDYDFLGLFGYVAAFFIIVLAILPRRRSSIPLFWFGFVLLYLSFGTASLEKYSFLITWPRFLLLLAPSMMLIISFGFFTAIEKIGRHRLLRASAYAILAIVIAVLLVNAIIIIRAASYSEYKYAYPLINIGNFLISQYNANHNITIYGDFSIPIGIYYKYKTPIYALPLQCSAIAPNSLLVISNRSPLIKECNLTLEYKPGPPPSWLSHYNELDYIGEGLYNASVYSK